MTLPAPESKLTKSLSVALDVLLATAVVWTLPLLLGIIVAVATLLFQAM